VDGNGQKQYFIPATSIKGMVRNVMEIMSFSRMAPVALGNTIFGLRDMNNQEYSKNEIRGNKAGWLIYESERWIIKPTESDRVKIDSIERNYSNRLSWNSGVSFKEQCAIEKYKMCGITSFDKKVNIEFSHTVDKTGDIFEVDNNGEYDGYLVMFGAMDNKKYEYVFDNPGDKILELEDQNLIKKVREIEKGKSESLWNYFFDVLKLTKIPVFYKIDDKSRKVKHFGFSKLYRLNNGSYLKELSPVSKYNLDNGVDLAQTIFGYVGDDSLKGRVYFSHALAIGDPKEDGVKQEILGSPKASYYPLYLKQEGQIYNTYQSNKSELRGFKKYYSQNQQPNTLYTQEQLDSESMVRFNPLKSDTKFQLKIRYHNLRSVEIGALLSALTYHGNHSELRHNLGLAKSFGYGRVKFDLKMGNEKLNSYLKIFEELMNSHTQKLGKKWIDTDQIKDLGALAKVASDNSKLSYPKLEVDKWNHKNKRMEKTNEFNEIKRALEFLKNPSHYNSYSFKSLTS
jgi:CRISPR-associated protein (TIGR03986 family)